MLKIGQKAPSFTLNDKNGAPVSLSDFLGKTVVLYFYPKDNTSGCSKQAAAFAELNAEFESLGAVIIGVSRDSAASHTKFAEKYSLPFILLSDPEKTVHEAYGVWQEKKMCGKVSMGTVRTTFIINPEGIIENIMEKVKADTNPADTLCYLSAKK